MPTHDLEAAIRALNRKVLEDLDAREAAIDREAAEARATLDACDTRKRSIQEKRDSILAAHELYVETLRAEASMSDNTADPEGAVGDDVDAHPTSDHREQQGEASATVDAEKPKRRARVGPQRYLILSKLREISPLSIREIASYTGLTEKRVKDQIRADEKDDNVEATVVANGAGHHLKYSITPEGLELLERFEVYRKSKGLPIPTPEQASGDGQDDGNEGGSDDLRQSAPTE